MTLTNKKVLVAGLAKSGLSAAKFLLKKGARLTVTDINTEKDSINKAAQELNQLGANIELGPHNEHTFINSDLIVISPGVPHTILPIVKAMEKGIPVIGETELASRFIHVPIIAITGTNGKTTTTELVGNILQLSDKNVFVGGNIGTPLTDLLLDQQSVDVVVLEVSSFQLDTIDTFCPDVAAVLNITEDHLYRYDTIDSYAASKFNIYKNQQPEHIAILNGQDDNCVKNASTIKSQIFWLDAQGSEFQKNSVNCQSQTMMTFPFGLTVDISKTPLPGHHNRQNIAAAILASHAVGASFKGIQQAINTFKGLPHRVEYIKTINGISFYNDSKATNVDAVVKALSCFEAPIHLILGGQDKGGDYSTLIPLIQKNVCECILIGEAQDIIRNGLQSTTIAHVPFVNATTLESAIKKAYQNARQGDIVLLSPACASFDMFDSYNHRGNVFKQTVQSL
jgi:UDP-N-acetylmuramoylalanine--D-glutamate ligase